MGTETKGERHREQDIISYMPKKTVEEVSKPIESPVEKPLRPRSLTADELEMLAITEPEKARLLMDLQDRLKTKRTQESDFAGLRALQVRLLEEVEANIEATRRNQEMCSRARHMRENQTLALVGQRDNFGVMRLVCSRCQKGYEGIGGPKGLPMEIAQFLDTATIGGVNA